MGNPSEKPLRKANDHHPCSRFKSSFSQVRMASGYLPGLVRRSTSGDCGPVGTAWDTHHRVAVIELHHHRRRGLRQLFLVSMQHEVIEQQHLVPGGGEGLGNDLEGGAERRAKDHSIGLEGEGCLRSTVPGGGRKECVLVILVLSLNIQATA